MSIVWFRNKRLKLGLIPGSHEARSKPLEKLREIERGAGPSHELVWLDGVGVRRKRCHDSRVSRRLELGVRARDAGSNELTAPREGPTVAGVLPP